MASAIQKKSGNADLPQVASVFNTGADRLDAFDNSELILPRAKLVQAMDLGNEKFQAFKIGDLVNTLTGEKMKARKFIPIKIDKQWIKWREPRGSGIEYAATSRNEVPPDDLLSHNGAQPAAIEYHNWVVIFEGDDTPVIISLKTTQIRASRELATMEKLRGKKGPGLYEYSVQSKKNDKGSWVVPQFRSLGNPPEDLLSVASELYSSLASVRVVSDEQGESTPEFNPDAE